MVIELDGTSQPYGITKVSEYKEGTYLPRPDLYDIIPETTKEKTTEQLPYLSRNIVPLFHQFCGILSHALMHPRHIVDKRLYHFLMLFNAAHTCRHRRHRRHNLRVFDLFRLLSATLRGRLTDTPELFKSALAEHTG